MEPYFPYMGDTPQLTQPKIELSIYWYKVPEGYGFAAQDPCGDVFAYENCPVVRNEKWATNTGKRIYLGRIPPHHEWHRILTQRPML